MINIVNDLEKISKLETGEASLKYEIFDLNELVEDTVEFMEVKAEKENITLSLNPDKPEPYTVIADKEAVRQVLTNLLDNAIKYNNKVTGKIDVALFDMDEKVLVEISDNGAGIPQEALARIFERFYRTDEARSRKTGGSGLGLAIVKHIIEAHKQTVTVRNNEHEGATFSFTLQKAK